MSSFTSSDSAQKRAESTASGSPPRFVFSSLWKPAQVNPLNLKSYTLPIFNLRDPYARSFHLSWIGFHVAFLSWFAFPPLLPEAIKKDLKLTTKQVGNSNIVALCATLLVRMIVGPLVDRYGPRKVMAALLVIGAIPSGLAGTVHTANSLYVIRFFIGILGGTFVPCQAWATCFFDTNVVGTANALVGGWGNAGGGTTFIIMTVLYQGLTNAGLSSQSAWRSAFAIVPVPALITVAVLIMVFGTDHPAGKWEDRHKPLAAAGVQEADPEMERHFLHPDELTHRLAEAGTTNIAAVEDSRVISEVDVAVNKPLTLALAFAVVKNPLTWLPALAYLTTFGFELAIESNLANIIFAIHRSHSFTQRDAGYIASIFGLLNIFSRPFGGILADLLYRRYGVPGKKYLTLGCGVLLGALSIGFGFYVDSSPRPDLATVIALMCLVALFNEMGNGANFSLVPHTNAYSNGFMSGIVGASGNLGGVFFTLVYRFQPLPSGKAIWIVGIVVLVVNMLLVAIPVPRR